MSPGFPFVLFGVIAAVAIVAVYFGFQQQKKRREALRAWAGRNGLRFDSERDRGMEDRFPLHACLRHGSNRYAENVSEGEREGRGVCCFDYHYETYSRDSEGRQRTDHTYFSAVVVQTDLPLRQLSIRPEGFFDKITEFLGYDDIDFESSAFSRAFYVKAPDRKWAFDVLHQATMEFLLGVPRFTIEMAGAWILVRRGRRFEPEDFDAALHVAEGILERLPRYLLRELKGEAR